jgi:phage baseplate assembly protein W
MMPTFGSGLTARVFDNNDAMFESLIQAEVYSAVGRWEPRAIIRGVDVVREDSTVTVTVGYVVIATQQPDSVELVLSTPQ